MPSQAEIEEAEEWRKKSQIFASDISELVRAQNLQFNEVFDGLSLFLAAVLDSGVDEMKIPVALELFEIMTYRHRARVKGNTQEIEKLHKRIQEITLTKED